MYKFSCRQCGKLFEAKRDDADYCSTKCRVAHHRSLDKRYPIQRTVKQLVTDNVTDVTDNQVIELNYEPIDD